MILQDQRLERSLRARDAELMITALDDRVSAELALRVDQQARSASLRLAATQRRSERISIDVRSKT